MSEPHLCPPHPQCPPTWCQYRSPHLSMLLFSSCPTVTLPGTTTPTVPRVPLPWCLLHEDKVEGLVHHPMSPSTPTGSGFATTGDRDISTVTVSGEAHSFHRLCLGRQSRAQQENQPWSKAPCPTSSQLHVSRKKNNNQVSKRSIFSRSWSGVRREMWFRPCQPLSPRPATAALTEIQTGTRCHRSLGHTLHRSL